MKLEIPISFGIFIVLFSFLLSVFLNKVGSFIRKEINFKPLIFKLLDENSEVSLVSRVKKIPIELKENSSINRTNLPIELEIVFDDECEGIALNSSLRVYDEDWNSYPIKIVKANYCFKGYLKNATITFPVNITANSSSLFYLFFHNIEVNPPKNFEFNTSDWVPSNGDSFTENESIGWWYIIEGIGDLSCKEERIYGNCSVTFDGSFSGDKVSIKFNKTIEGVSNGWYLRFYFFLNNTNLTNILVKINDGNETIYKNVSEFKRGWNLFEERIERENWQNWTAFNASNGIKFFLLEAFNNTESSIRVLIDGLRFEKPPLIRFLYPEQDVVVLDKKKIKLWEEVYEKRFGIKLYIE